MFAIDHGYFQGPTTGLERVDLTSAIVPYADALMLTRGIYVPPCRRHFTTPVVLRCQRRAEHSLEESHDEAIAIDIDDAVRLNVPPRSPGVYRRRV